MKKITSTVAIVLTTLGLNAQVSIGNVTPDNNSILDLRNSNSRGFVLPVAPGLMPTSPDGIMFYNTGISKIFYKESGGYNALSPWRYKFNSSTSDNTYFDTGNVGIGTNNPQRRLHLKGNSDMLVLEGTNRAEMLMFPEGFSGSKAGLYVTSSWMVLRNYKSGNPIYIESEGGGNIHLSSVNGTPQVLINGSNIKSTSNTLNVEGKIQENGNNLIPSGVIVMWNGTSAPAGWAVCDGSNGTPDLRGRFVAGRGTQQVYYEDEGSRVDQNKTAGWSLGETGGANRIILSEAQMPTHTHSSYVTDTYVSYIHKQGGFNEVTGGADWDNVDVLDDFSYTRPSVTIGTAGSGNTVRAYPPYYVLTYIMKL